MALALSGKALAAGDFGLRYPAQKPAASALRLTMVAAKVGGIGPPPGSVPERDLLETRMRCGDAGDFPENLRSWIFLKREEGRETGVSEARRDAIDSTMAREFSPLSPRFANGLRDLRKIC
jgi:hypothetical protein